MEANKERTLANIRFCSCCKLMMWDDGKLMEVNEWRVLTYGQVIGATPSVCSPCIDEADDQGITVEQLRERNNERSVETESY